MSKVLKVENGNYKVTVQSGGTITLDTGVETGTTIVTGDLEVKGTTTTVKSVNTTISDNILTLNEGELGSGISASNNYKAGIEIDRGSLAVGRWIWDDQINYTMGGDSGSGVWTSITGTGTDFTPIKIPGVVGTGTNFFFDIGSGVLSVTGTSDYEEQIFQYAGGVITGGAIDDDNIPNAKAVVDYIAFSLGSVFQDRIEEGTTTKTFVEAKDFEVTGSASAVEIGIDNVIKLSVKNDTIEIGDIQIDGTTIRPINSSNNLFLEGTGAGEIVARDLFSIENTISTPTSAPDRLKLYVNTEDTGGTGLFFVNSTNTNDELISNNRSLLYSMLF
jgi:hypothetical protein|tara:strand:+ start:23954 stop:24949 length:996 start_codon:yes stop_codon:yes gene_type:complete